MSYYRMCSLRGGHLLVRDYARGDLAQLRQRPATRLLNASSLYCRGTDNPLLNPLAMA